MDQKGLNSSVVKTVKHVYLLSSPSYFVGECDVGEIKILHAFSWNMGKEGFHVLEFETKEPVKLQPGTPLADYSPTGEQVAYLLSVLFGKLIIPNGMLMREFRYSIPEIVSLSRYDKDLPFYSDFPRVEFPIPLERHLVGAIDSEFLSPNFLNACRLYHKALAGFPDSPDVAYIDLVTSGEILTSSVDYEEDEDFYGEELKAALSILTNEGERGKALASFLKKQNKLKKKYISGLMRSKDFNIYSPDTVVNKLTQENLKSAIAASYDLRSKYLHEGLPIGSHVAWTDFEVGLSYSFSTPHECKKILQKAPSFHALERVVRMALLLSMFESLEKEIKLPTKEEPFHFIKQEIT